MVGPAPVKIDLSLFRAADSCLGIPGLGLARSFSSLEDGNFTVASLTLVDDSSEVVEQRGVGTESVEVINSTIIRGTEDVEDSLETTVVLDVFLGVEDHGADVVAASEETRVGIRDDLTFSVDLFEGNIDTSESKGGESEDADKE